MELFTTSLVAHSKEFWGTGINLDPPSPGNAPQAFCAKFSHFEIFPNVSQGMAWRSIAQLYNS
jgi:hypothetical protein